MPLKLYKRGKIWHYRGHGCRKAPTRIYKDCEQGNGPTNCRQQRTVRLERSSRSAIGPNVRTSRHALSPSTRNPTASFARSRTIGRIRRFREITPGAIRAAAISLYPTAGPATRNDRPSCRRRPSSIMPPSTSFARTSGSRASRSRRKAKEPVTWEWVQAFMAHAKKPNLAALACFMYLTGARISQALAVQWSDVDFRSRKVLIRATNKGDDDRRAHMPSELIAALANIPGERTGPVFGFKSRGNCRTQWAGAIRRAGIKKPIISRLPTWLCHRTARPGREPYHCRANAAAGNRRSMCLRHTGMTLPTMM